MTDYIDGFVLPVPRDCLDDYRKMAQAVGQIWMEHGALRYIESIVDDTHLEGTRSFDDLVASSEQEAVIFGWVEFESRAARDRANEKVAADPRMRDLVSPSSGFDASRMVYGGFRTLVARSTP